MRNTKTGSVQCGMDEYEAIQCVNFIRNEVAAGRDALPQLAAAAAAPTRSAEHSRPWREERYLIPFMQDDALLLYSYDEAEGCALSTCLEPHSTASLPGL